VEVSLAPLLELAEETAPDVAAHMDRTAHLALRFGLQLDLSPDLLDQTVRTARVHDIGRLPMPDSTDAHFIAGQKILARKPALLPLATLVRSMNERWNGSGVPDGLSGSAIPLATRIVAVCETFDSLTNPLDGAEPMSTDGALLELVERAGTDLDPGVVEPFRDLALEMDRAEEN